MKKWLIELVALALEFWLVISIYENLFNNIPILQKPASSFYDGIVVSLVASFLFLALTKFNDILVFLIGKGSRALCLIYIRVSDIRSRLDETISRAYKFLMSAKVKWGPTLKNSTRKIANVAEALLAISHYRPAKTIAGSDKKEIDKVLKRLIDEQREEGYKSYNLGKYTTHCTAMTLFVIKQYHNQEIYRLTEKQSADFRKSAEHLLSSGTSLGWGTYNETVSDEKLIRLFSTFWALRALNAWDLSSDAKYADILSSLLNRVPDGKFGFSLDSQYKTSTISLFLILIKEIEDTHIQKMISQKLTDKDIKKLLCLLIKDLKTSIETEEYLLETSGECRKLSWTHFSFFLSVSALSQYANLLNCFSRLKLMLAVSAVLKTQFHKDGYYYNEKLNLITSDPFTYPTAYAIMGLSDFERNLGRF